MAYNEKDTRTLNGDKQYDQIRYVLLIVVYDSLTVDAFEMGWNKVMEKYEL